MPAPDSSPYPSARAAWAIVGVLVAASTLSFIDRMLLTLLVAPIREAFAISDLQLSLLHGFAYAATFAGVGLPIARWTDRSRRTRILALSTLAFSAATAACGLARGFVQMFLARAAVGCGSAGISPAAYSIISDVFPPEDRARPLSAFSAAIFLGSGLAMVAGAGLVAWAPAVDLPGLSAMAPWRRVFVLVAIPGVAAALLLGLVHEPARRERLPGAGDAVPIRVAAAYVWERRRAYAALIGGDALRSMLHNGVIAWLPTFFVRTHGATPAGAGLRVGIAIAVFGSLGAYAGGVASRRLRARGQVDADLRVAVVGGAARLAAVTAPLLPSAEAALAGYAFFLFVSGATTGVAVSAIQAITPNQLRAQVAALFLFVINLAGIGLGASLVAALTDLAFQDDAALRYSLAAAAAVTTPLGVAWIWRGMRPYRATVAAAPF